MVDRSKDCPLTSVLKLSFISGLDSVVRLKVFKLLGEIKTPRLKANA
jgi:hypothetical protein